MYSHQMPQSRSTDSFFKSLLDFLFSENDEDLQARVRGTTFVLAAMPALPHGSSSEVVGVLSGRSELRIEVGDSAPRLRLATSYSGVSSMRSKASKERERGR